VHQLSLALDDRHASQFESVLRTLCHQYKYGERQIAISTLLGLVCKGQICKQRHLLMKVAWLVERRSQVLLDSVGRESSISHECLDELDCQGERVEADDHHFL